MNDYVEATEWEGWEREVWGPEVDGFEARARELRGLTEEALRAELGAPHLEMPGFKRWSASGELIFEADSDLRYVDLLPHTQVMVHIKNDSVVGVSYIPKWKRCPADRITLLGAAYAPA